MSYYLTYTRQFQNEVINAKRNNVQVNDIVKKFNISIYTLYKILHLNNEMPIPSQASAGKDSEEGVEHRCLSPNNNNIQERPASTWKHISCRHKKVEHICLNCKEKFLARNRGSRTKFCSKSCKNIYCFIMNSVVKICDNCGKEFRIKRSQSKVFIHCGECRGKKLGSQSSKMSRQIGKWLLEEFITEKEKSFKWFYDKNKPNGRFKLDFFLPVFNLGIEYDGEQHFKPSFTSRWESVEKVQKRDNLKEKLCKEYNIKIVRFKYDEDISKKSMLMKIYAELRGNESVEVEDKKPLR